MRRARFVLLAAAAGLAVAVAGGSFVATAGTPCAGYAVGTPLGGSGAGACSPVPLPSSFDGPIGVDSCVAVNTTTFVCARVKTYVPTP